jgi:two-component system sensor histidine kinase FlrB
MTQNPAIMTAEALVQTCAQPEAAMSDPLFDAIPGAVIVLDADGRVARANAAARNLLAADDLPQQDLHGQQWRDLVASRFLPDLDQGELRTADGRQFNIATRPLGYAPGQVLLLSEVTQTRQLQRAAQQNLHLMTLGRMMASLAHQIRTPLTSTLLYLSQIDDGKLDAGKQARFNRKALDRVRHIENTINDMLSFAHGGRFHMCDFPVQDLMNELKEQLQPQLSRHRARLDLVMPDSSLMINGNRSALLGALANLCMNALDAGDGRQTLVLDISLSLTRQGQLAIRIEDNGCGMAAETLEHLFDPFFTTKMDGTGLGLAVVKSVIESHQGSIRVESQLGQGSVFEILLPCQQASQTQLSGKDSSADMV